MDQGGQAIVGALAGLALPATVVQVALGCTILAIVALMATAKKSEYPEVAKPDRLSVALGLHGVFHDAGAQRDVA